MPTTAPEPVSDFAERPWLRALRDELRAMAAQGSARALVVAREPRIAAIKAAVKEEIAENGAGNDTSAVKYWAVEASIRGL